MISANTKKRIQAISIEGKVADRYFAVTSETPRNTVDARMRAMPLNGRSARAGARRAKVLFSGNGRAMLSSLAATAAAGGGVTANLWRNFESNGPLKNAKFPCATTPDSGMPICALRAALQHSVKEVLSGYSIGRGGGLWGGGKGGS